jgi:hypothetical protein
MTTKVTHQASGASRPQAMVTNFDIDKLRAEIERLTLADRQWADHVRRLSEDNERLKADPYQAGYIDGHHDAHARRGESYRDCPRCVSQT